MAKTIPVNPADPIEASRMSFGDHLEELRKRVIYAIAGLAACTLLTFYFGDKIIEYLAAPYTATMRRLGFDPQMVQLSPAEPFIEYFKISLKFGLVLSAPWVLYQMWAFVAAGLYPHERRMVRLFAPASIGLFVSGAGFMVVFALSPLLSFLIGASTWFPLPNEDNALYSWLRGDEAMVVPATQPAAPVHVPIVEDDPAVAGNGEIWFNAKREHLMIQVGDTRYEHRMTKAAARQFVQPFFSVAEYLAFVTNLALAFGLGFQIPLVVIFLIRVGLVPSKSMRSARKYVIFGIAVASALLTPSPDVGTMMMLAVPMYLLFEVGLFIGRRVEPQALVGEGSS